MVRAVHPETGPSGQDVDLPARPGEIDPFTTRSRDPVKYRLFTAAETAMYWSGAAAVFSRVALPPGAAVLTYHSVLAPGEENFVDPSNALPARQFERQMRFLSRRRRPTTMSRLVDDLAADRPIRRGTVVVTFDDGYMDVLRAAAPVLTRYGVPAIVYLSTGWIQDGVSPWIDRLYTAFKYRTRDEVSFAEIPGASRRFHNGEAVGVYHAIGEHCIPLPMAKRDELLGEVERQLRPKSAMPKLIMNWDAVRTLVREHPGIELGVHTVDHLDMTSCNDEQVHQQIQGSIDAVVREVGVRPLHFSFPFDRSDARTRAIAKSCGVRSSVGAGYEGLAVRGADLYAIPRLSTTPRMNRLRFTTCGAYPELSRIMLRRPKANGA